MSKENELPQIESKLEFDPNVPHVQGSMIPEDEDNKTNVEEHSDVKPKDLIEPAIKFMLFSSCIFALRA